MTTQPRTLRVQHGRQWGIPWWVRYTTKDGILAMYHYAIKNYHGRIYSYTFRGDDVLERHQQKCWEHRRKFCDHYDALRRRMIRK